MVDRTIQICRVFGETSQSLQSFSSHTDEVNAISWSPGGTFLASCSDDLTAKIWTLEEGLRAELTGHEKEIYTVRWTPCGPGSANPDKPLLLCSASFDGTVKVRRRAFGVGWK